MSSMFGRAAISLLGALIVITGLAARAGAEEYPVCSHCSPDGPGSAPCWSSARVLGTCAEDGQCADQACAGPGESHAQAIARYIQGHHLSGCSTVDTTVNGLKARSCPQSLVVFNPTRRCAFGLSKSTAGGANGIVAVWSGNSVVEGVSYRVGVELGAPLSEARTLRTAAGGDGTLYQIFDRGGISVPASGHSLPGGEPAYWVGGRSEPWMRALGEKWREEPFILFGNASSVEGGWTASGRHDARWPTSLYTDGGPALKIGGTTDVRAAIWRRWQQLGGLAGVEGSLGRPLSDEANGAQRFVHGNLATDGSNGSPTAYLLGEPHSQEMNALYDLWQSEAAALRTAAFDTRFDPANGGGWRVDNDMSGSERASFVVKRGEETAHAVAGDVLAHWQASGEASGFLKWPTADAAPIEGGTLQEFEGGHVYQQTGGPVYAVEGGASPLLAGYLAAGGPGGPLGFPVEDTQPVDPQTGKSAQRFQHGSMSTNGTVAVPDYDDGPDPHSYPSAQRTGAGVIVRWFDSGPPVTIVSRLLGTGPFTTLDTQTRPSGPAFFVDTHPVTGAINCYRITAAEQTGACGAGNRCVHTPIVCANVPLQGEAPLSRVQLRVKVGTVEGADLDGSIQVVLGPNNSSWIDTPRDDFEKGSNVMFDLQTTKIPTASDITGLLISVPGDDGLCVDELELLLNCNDVQLCPGRSVFKKVFGPTTCAWIKNSERPADEDSERLAISFQELRAPTLFGVWPQPFPIAPGAVSVASIASMVDAAVAHDFHGTLLNPRFREGENTLFVVKNEKTLGISQFIQLDCGVLCTYGTVALDVSFDLVLEEELNANGQLVTRVHTRNLDVESTIDGWMQIFDPFWSQHALVLQFVVNQVVEHLISPPQLPELPVPPGGEHFCFAGGRLTTCQ